MKKIKLTVLILVGGAILNSSCATIAGGSKYNAHIIVKNNPKAKIIYQGEVLGTGNTTLLLKRKDANKLSFKVQDENCPEKEFNFKSRTFRGWALVGSIVTWTISINGIPLLPIGAIIDLSNGSLWKPNVMEKGVTKANYKNFKYTVEYLECGNNALQGNFSDVIYLKNGTIIKGSIIENIPKNRIQIRLSDGNINVYNYQEIDKVEKESSK